MSRSTPNWYKKGDLMETVQTGTNTGATTDEMVTVLSEHEFQELSRQRVSALVSSTAERAKDYSEEPDLSQQPSTAADPEGYDGRHVTRADVEVLTDKEFAFLLMGVLSRFDGNAIRPEHVDIDVDLFWHRQHRTIAFRTISRPEGVPVEASDVTDVVEGDTEPRSGRSPSRVVLLTNSYLTDEANTAASQSDLDVRDGTHLTEWLHRTRVSIGLLGDLLEHGEKREYDLEERLDEVSSNASFVEGFEPLESTGYDVELDVSPSAVAQENTGRSPPNYDGTSTTRETNSTTDDTGTATTQVEEPSDDDGVYLCPDCGKQFDFEHVRDKHEASCEGSRVTAQGRSSSQEGATKPTSAGSTSTTGPEDVVAEYDPASGRVGKLYADEGDDGDYGAFDTLTDDFEEADDS